MLNYIINMKNHFVKLFLFVSIFCFSQTKRDSILKNAVILPINQGFSGNNNNYLKSYSILNQLDLEYGYEKYLHKRMLEYSYRFNDTLSFKSDLTILVKEFGFKIDLLSGDEIYYNAIIDGELSIWFKEMYLKNHLIWLNENFNKLKDLRKLNDSNIKDQALAKLASILINVKLNTNDSITVFNAINRFNLENINVVYEISKKYDIYVNSKKFPIIQNGLDTVLVHNLRDNTDYTWNLLYPYIKKAYINNEVDNVIFQNYDFYCFLKNGYQEFNSYSIEQIPEQFRKNKKEIKLKSTEEFQIIKKEFKWY